MKHGSLFSGIGGFDLAAKWCNWENVFQVEKDEFCQNVLAKNFPNSKRYGEIKEFKGSQYKGTIDVVSGGFPCQPFSHAGKRGGANDDRYLWPEMLRIIDEVKPYWVVGENVAGIASMDIETNVLEMEDSESYFLWVEKVLQRIITDLNSIGYDLPRTNQGEPIFFNIPACATGAPHRRDRIWIIAHDESWINGKHNGRKKNGQVSKSGKSVSSTSYTNPNGFYGYYAGFCSGEIPQQQKTEVQRGAADSECKRWERHWLEVASELCRVDDGVSSELDKLRNSDRTNRLKALGNAIVPQVAFQIFRSIDHISGKSI